MAGIALGPIPEPEGVVEIRAEIDEGWLELALRRGEFEAALDEAKRILIVFADENGLSPPRGIETARLTVHPSQDLLWREANKTPKGRDPPALPRKTLVALGGGYSVTAVTPEEFARVVPEYAALRPDAWIRLIAHELVHGWHPELSRPRQLGPAWFVEGLAVIVADQGFGEDLQFSSAEAALEPMDGSDRHAYATYAARLRFFMQHAPVAQLIDRAGLPEFEAWLRTLPEGSARGGRTVRTDSDANSTR